jgi:periplasmic copper chaperone A
MADDFSEFLRRETMRHVRIAGVRITTIIMALLALGAYGFAGQTGHGDHTIHLENPWARRTPPMALQEQGGHGGSALTPENSAVYVTVRNRGSEPDALVSAMTDVATTVELHETVTKDGTMVMQPRPQFDIPAGGTLEMKPGSYHIMLLGIKQALNPGDAVPVTLTFQKAGQMAVQALVK